MTRKKPHVNASEPAPVSGLDGAPVPAPKGKGGPPLGNLNASKDAEFALRMRRARRLAKRGSARVRRECAARTDALLREMCLEASPLARRLGARLTSLDFRIIEADRISNRVDFKMVRADHSIAPIVQFQTSLEREDRVECRKLLDDLAVLQRANGGAVITGSSL